jgi:hypothetical protein
MVLIDVGVAEMNELTIAPERRVWLRAFWGFGPEDGGYLGFTLEGKRHKQHRDARRLRSFFLWVLGRWDLLHRVEREIH